LSGRESEEIVTWVVMGRFRAQNKKWKNEKHPGNQSVQEVLLIFKIIHSDGGMYG